MYPYPYAYMAKNVSIADDVYLALKRRKRQNESFTDLIRRLMEARPAIADVMGKELLTQDDWRTIRQHLAEMQKRSAEKMMQNEAA